MSRLSHDVIEAEIGPLPLSMEEVESFGHERLAPGGAGAKAKERMLLGETWMFQLSQRVVQGVRRERGKKKLLTQSSRDS